MAYNLISNAFLHGGKNTQLEIIISSKNLSSKGEVPKNNMCAFFVNYLLEQGVYKEEILEYEFGNLIKLSSEDKHEDSSKIIPSVNEVLNPKNIKIFLNHLKRQFFTLHYTLSLKIKA
jgi:hypothetical protein